MKRKFLKNVIFLISYYKDFKTQNIPSKQEYELINKIQSPRMIQENFDRLIILKEKQVSEYKDDPLLLDNKVIKTLIEKIQSQENIFDIFKDECESKNFIYLFISF